VVKGQFLFESGFVSGRSLSMYNPPFATFWLEQGSSKNSGLETATYKSRKSLSARESGNQWWGGVV